MKKLSLSDKLAAKEKEGRREELQKAFEAEQTRLESLAELWGEWVEDEVFCTDEDGNVDIMQFDPDRARAVIDEFERALPRMERAFTGKSTRDAASDTRDEPRSRRERSDPDRTEQTTRVRVQPPGQKEDEDDERSRKDPSNDRDRTDDKDSRPRHDHKEDAAPTWKRVSKRLFT